MIKIDYTIRKVYTCLADIEVGEIQFSFYILVESYLVKKGLLHKMRIRKIVFNTIPKDILPTNKALEFMGNQKPRSLLERILIFVDQSVHILIDRMR